jgi:hypothetical protein
VEKEAAGPSGKEGIIIGASQDKKPVAFNAKVGGNPGRNQDALGKS